MINLVKIGFFLFQIIKMLPLLILSCLSIFNIEFQTSRELAVTYVDHFSVTILNNALNLQRPLQLKQMCVDSNIRYESRAG